MFVFVCYGDDKCFARSSTVDDTTSRVFRNVSWKKGNSLTVVLQSFHTATSLQITVRGHVLWQFTNLGELIGVIEFSQVCVCVDLVRNSGKMFFYAQIKCLSLSVMMMTNVLRPAVDDTTTSHRRQRANSLVPAAVSWACAHTWENTLSLIPESA